MLVITSIFALSCTKYSHLYKVESNSAHISKDNFYIFENDSVKITYSFWGNRGVLAYTLYNKMSVPIYLDWKKSSFVRNSQKLDYWVDETFTKGVTSSNYGLYPGYYDLLTISSTRGVTKSSKPERITFIAPKSAITRVNFTLFTDPSIKVHDPSEETTLIENDNKHSYLVKYWQYNFQKNPLSFRNFLTISTTENFQEEKYIDNEFYVSSVTKLKSSLLIPKSIFNKQSKKYENYNPFISPTLFYIQ